MKEPVSDVEVQLNVLAELELAFRAAIRLCGDAAQRLRDARTEYERQRIGAEVEGFVRRLALGALALGAPGIGQRSDVKKETP
jgi:hypothetical protein